MSDLGHDAEKSARVLEHIVIRRLDALRSVTPVTDALPPAGENRLET